MRAINAVRELNDERDEPISVIALYTEERAPRAVRAPGRRAPLPRPRDDRRRRRRPAQRLPRLRAPRARADRDRSADAAWVGWGFVAEHPAFAELCDRLGIVFAGPDADVMRALGDKIEGKRLAEQAGVPVAPVERRARSTASRTRSRHGRELGFPLMIKAAAGGGGRGMRRVDAAERDRGGVRARPRRGGAGVRRPERADGAPRRRRAPRRGPADGRRRRAACGRSACATAATSAATRRSSRSPPARRWTPSRSASSPRPRCGSRARRGYRGAGTVEFLYEPESGRFSFMEVNTRLQVEHPVTEAVTGADLVAPAAARRGRRPARGRPAAAARPRDRGPPQRRGPRPRLRARARADHAAAAAQRAPASASTAASPRATRVPPRVRLDDREDHRPRRHARAGDRAPAPRRRRHDGGDRRGHHQPGLPARAARPPRAALAARSTPAGSTACRRRATSSRCATPTPRSCRRRSRSARPPRPPSARASTRSPAAGARTPTPTSCHVRRPAAPRRELPLRGLPDRPGALPARGRRRAHRGDRRGAHRARAPPELRRALAPHRDRACRTPTCWSRSTASRTASRATRAG